VLQRGALSILTKPFDGDQLLNWISEALRRRNGPDGTVPAQAAD
jgi:DNA-binding response OmpR family regulator